ncbi:MAG: DUF4185 domain-containing protein [Bifidobacteriaceae bacterium]|jgi:hypothetical protein|nr:DUF4185 domain-containing protein [Bifidobacteriaceae bacterium]
MKTHMRKAMALTGAAALAFAGLVIAGTAAEAAPTMPPTRAIMAGKMTGREAVTPTNNNTYGNIGGTDLGILWDAGNGTVLAAFGDTFNTSYQTGNWRSSSLLFSNDHDLTDGMTWYKALMNSATQSKEIIPCKQATCATGENSAIPTGGIAVANPDNPSQYRNFVGYMSNTGFGAAGYWGIQYSGIYYSDDYGDTWAASTMRWLNPNSNKFDYQPFQMINFAQKPGDQYVYMFGTGPGRHTPVAVARATQRDFYNMDQSKFEYWITDRWVTTTEDPQAADNATPVMGDFTNHGVGELGIGYDQYSGLWLSVHQDNDLDIVLQTAPEPTGPWSEPYILVTTTDHPQLYGGFLHPWSLGNQPDKYFALSDWAKYSTFLMRFTINKDGSVTRPNLIADPNLERQGSTVGGAWSTDAVSGVDSAGNISPYNRAYSGWKSVWMRLDGSGGQTGTVSMWQQVTLKPNTDYALWCWVRMNDETATVVPDAHLGVREVGGGAVIAQTSFSETTEAQGYIRQYIEFNSGSLTTVEVFLGGELSLTNPWLNIDTFGLIEKDPPTLDKTALEAAIADGASRTVSDYTTSSVGTFPADLAAAKVEDADLFTTQDDIDAATQALEDAIAALVLHGDAGALTAVLDFIDAQNLTGTYTAASIAALQTKVTAGRTVAAAEADKTQAQIDQALTDVQTAFAALVALPPAVDKTVLQSLVNSVDKLAANSSMYTAASWVPVATALATAKQVLAGSPTQAQVTAQINAIHQAVAGLKPAPASTTGQGTTPSTPTPSGPTARTYASFTLSPDLNGDGRGEILAIHGTSGELFGFEASASGGLTKQTTLVSGLLNQQAYGPGDWDGDGKADVVSVDAAGYMWLYSGTGKGSVGSKVEIGHGWSPFRVIPAGDLNADGANDLLAIDQSGKLWLYAGNGHGGFKGQPKQVGQGWVGLDLYAAGDLNADGHNDILAVLPDGTLWAYAGRGNGTFSVPKQVGRGWGTFELAAGADLNGDGRADIVGRNNATGDLYYYQGNGGGSFQAAKQIATGW